METKVIDTSMRERWERFIASHPDSIAWQSFAWNDVLSKHYPVTFYPIAAFDGGSLRGILPLYHVRTRLGKNHLISVPYAVAGGIVAEDSETQAELLRAAVGIAERHDHCRITLKQYKREMAGDLLTDRNFHNNELNLTNDVDALFNGFPDSIKAAIDRAERLPLSFEYPSPDIAGFYKVLLAHHHRRGLPCVSESWISDLVACGMYSVGLIKRDGRILAGTMVKEFKTTISFPFTSVWSADDEDCLPRRLYWELLRHFAVRGKEIFHSGRIPNTNETDAYRLGWGGRRHNYFYQYYPNTGARTEFAKKRGKKREWIQLCWKRIPRSLACRLGPFIVREYP